MDNNRDIERKIVAQEAYCAKHKCPRYAPKNGICWKCKKQIYERISLEEASTTPITSCSWCGRAYDD